MEPLFPADARLKLFSRTIIGLVSDKHPDLTLRQMAALLMFCEDTDAAYTATSVAAHLNISKPALTQSLDRLEHLGLIKRESSLSDRRKIFIRPAAAYPNFLRSIKDLLGSVRV